MTAKFAYEVRGIPKGSTQELVLRRFPTEAEAEAHPIKMPLWESVRVARVYLTTKPEFVPPRLPFDVEWLHRSCLPYRR